MVLTHWRNWQFWHNFDKLSVCADGILSRVEISLNYTFSPNSHSLTKFVKSANFVTGCIFGRHVTMLLIAATVCLPSCLFCFPFNCTFEICFFFISHRQQELSNLISDRKYLEAIGLAITLGQPFRVLNIIKGINGAMMSFICGCLIHLKVFSCIV